MSILGDGWVDGRNLFLFFFCFFFIVYLTLALRISGCWLLASWRGFFTVTGWWPLRVWFFNGTKLTSILSSENFLLLFHSADLLLKPRLFISLLTESCSINSNDYYHLLCLVPSCNFVALGAILSWLWDLVFKLFIESIQILGRFQRNLKELSTLAPTRSRNIIKAKNIILAIKGTKKPHRNHSSVQCQMILIF